jgi:signal transduction histidine kinase
LVGALLATGSSILLALTVSDRVPRGAIVVYGDLDTPGMREVYRELRQRAAAGEPLTESFGDYNLGFAAIVVLLLFWIGVGVFVVWRQPRNWAGWLLILTGLPLPMLTLVQALTVYGLKVEPGSIPFIGVLALVSEYALYPLTLLPLLFLLYPDGHVPSPRWRWAVAGLLGGMGLAFLAFLLRPGPLNGLREDGILYENPLGVDAFTFGGGLIGVGAIVALVSAVSMAVAVVLRFRRSRGEERQQMRVLAFVAAVAAASIITMFVLSILAEVFQIGEQGDEPPVIPILFGFTALTLVVGIPGSYVVAILRHRLWDLDVVIRKALIFAVAAGSITVATLVLVLIVPVAVLGTGLSGWERGLLILGVVLGMLVGPLRRWARRLADRLVFGGRATPYEVVTQFSARVSDTYATDDVLQRMAKVLAEGTGALGVRVLLRVGAELREVAMWPTDGVASPPLEHVVPVIHQGAELGALAVAMPANDPIDPPRERLVRDLAAQAGLVLRNVKLIEELRASRRRIVSAQDERAKKLERNIHDGAQQRLVALSVKLKLAEQLTARDPAKAQEILSQLQSETTEALEELRDLARGIYPPLLADKGLAAALEGQARKAPLPVEVSADGAGRYPPETEAAVYFSCLEALQNIAKYANATRAEVRLTHLDGHLTFEVTDDGAGFDPATTGYGTGLQGMADRLDAIGGTLEITSAPGAGTTVTGSIPIPPAVQPGGSN